MTRQPLLLITPYNDPDPRARAVNVAKTRAIARWALDHGFAPVSSVLILASEQDAPEDTAGLVREAVLSHSETVAAMVGAAGGQAVTPGWCVATEGMRRDERAYQDAWVRLGKCSGPNTYVISWSEVEPYYTAPVETVPRAEVQAAAKWIMDCQEMAHGNDEYVAFGIAVDVIEEYTGVTPTEVTNA